MFDEKAYNKKWRETHKDKVKQYNDTWRKIHREQLNEYRKQYYKTHKDKFREKWKQQYYTLKELDPEKLKKQQRINFMKYHYDRFIESTIDFTNKRERELHKYNDIDENEYINKTFHLSEIGDDNE